MRKIYSMLSLLLLLSITACDEGDIDPLGDLIVDLVDTTALTQTPSLNEARLGIFPSESLLTGNFTAPMALQTLEVDLTTDDDEVPRAIFTSILPGIYVVAFIATNSTQEVPQQVIQIAADDVTYAELMY